LNYGTNMKEFSSDINLSSAWRLSWVRGPLTGIPDFGFSFLRFVSISRNKNEFLHHELPRGL
jgi:hypothetical protein